MSGLRIYSPLISESLFNKDYYTVADSDDLAQAVKIPLKYLGNVMAQGGTDLINWSDTLLSIHTKLRLTTDGGDNWMAFTLPTAEGVRDLLGSLTADDRLDASHIKGLDTTISSSVFDYISFNTTPTVGDWSPGKLYWSQGNSALVVDGNIDKFAIKIGLENYVEVTNNSGNTIYKGNVVSIQNMGSLHPTIVLANPSDPTKCQFIAVAATDMADATSGYVITQGELAGTSGGMTFDTSSVAAGDTLYCSATGTITNVKPSPPDYIIRIGKALYSHATLGIALIQIEHIDPTDITLDQLNINDDINLSDTSFQYWGDSLTNGSWRMGLSGDNFIIERRESDAWVTKSTIQA
jgi:hypothetical protein